MTTSETLSLFAEVRKIYPKDKAFANPSYKDIQTWTTALSGMSYEHAIEELRRHAKTSRFAPTIADFAHKGKYNRAVDGYRQVAISDEDLEKMVVLDMDGWHNGGQFHNGGIGDEEE